LFGLVETLVLCQAGDIGYFYAKKSSEQKIIGIRTDFRRAGESEGEAVNPMIECSCDWIVRSLNELLESLLRENILRVVLITQSHSSMPATPERERHNQV